MRNIRVAWNPEQEQSRLSVEIRSWLKDLLLIAALLSAIYALWTWKQTVDLGRSQRTRVDRIMDKGEGAVDDLAAFSSRLPRIADNISGAIGEGNAAIADFRSQMPGLTGQLSSLSGELRGELVDLRGLTVETRRQISENGEAANSDLKEFHRTLESINGLLTAPQVAELVDSLARSGANLEAASYRLKVIVEDPELATTLKQSARNIEVVTEQTAELTKHLANIAGEVDRKVGPQPAPKGFKARLGYYALKVLGYARDAAGVTFLVVKIVNGL